MISKNKYPSIFSRQMVAIMFIIPRLFFPNTRDFENWEYHWDIPQFQLWNVQSRDALRPIAGGRKYLRIIKEIIRILPQITREIINNNKTFIYLVQ